MGLIIDFTKVLNSSKAGSAAQQKLKKQFQAETKKFEKLEKEVRIEETNIISQKKALSPEEYKIVCNNTKIITQRAIMGANITDSKALNLYIANGGTTGKYSVNWDEGKNKCFAKFTVKPLKGSSNSVTVQGEALGFLRTSIDTRVYFIKNF